MPFRTAAGWSSLRNGVFLPYETSNLVSTPSGGGEPPPDPPSGLFDFEIVNVDGSTTITSVPNLRIQLSGTGSWHTLASASSALGVTLTLARGADGQSLVISGWPGGTVPAGTLVHYEQALPEEPNNAYTAEAGLFARKVGGPAPTNTKLFGQSIASTVWDAPVGVL